MLNPFRYLEREREKDREMFLAALREVVGQGNKQAEVAMENARIMRSILDMFLTPGQTSSRVIRDEDEMRAELERLGLLQPLPHN